jgi:hypothetical protein
MFRVRQQDLPFQGSSHQFVGADHGNVNVSVFLLSALHGFRCIGDAPLVQVDVHLSPRFVQENLA